MSRPRRFRIEEFLRDEEGEWRGLSLEAAAHQVDDLTGIGADVILSDWDEDCHMCEGTGKACGNIFGCSTCGGSGKRGEPWEWTDDETGRRVVMSMERN